VKYTFDYAGAEKQTAEKSVILLHTTTATHYGKYCTKACSRG